MAGTKRHWQKPVRQPFVSRSDKTAEEEQQFYSHSQTDLGKHILFECLTHKSGNINAHHRIISNKNII